jgi:hypothetical protein
MKDQLYLLKPGFMDKGTGPFFCPGCALVEGMLSFYPVLREKIEVHYIDFPRPRPELVILGEDNQGAPKLILGDNNGVVPAGVNVATANGRMFIANNIEICKYLASVYGVGTPH